MTITYICVCVHLCGRIQALERNWRIGITPYFLYWKENTLTVCDNFHDFFCLFYRVFHLPGFNIIMTYTLYLFYYFARHFVFLETPCPHRPWELYKVRPRPRLHFRFVMQLDRKREKQPFLSPFSSFCV